MSYLLICSVMLLSQSAFSAEPVCARVKIEIRQELTLERQAFDAMMRINNTLDSIAIENVNINVNFKDEAGNPVLASSDPNNTTAKFFIRVDSMDQIADVSGAGRVEPNTSAEIHWLIIPAPGAAEGSPTGKLYFVGATLDYTIGGQAETVETVPDFITVKPLPLLTLDYFLSKDVIADDPLTPEIEAIEPYTLGVRIQNNGAGPAQNVKIDSAQPEIIENEQGLLIGFEIIGSSVDDQPTAPTLLIDFGEIAANRAKVGRWSMTSTLAGEFVDFSATFSHADELGGQLTSIIDATNAHFLVRDVRVNEPGRDNVRDFLAWDGGILRAYESDNVDTVVNDLSASATFGLLGANGTEVVHNLTVPVTPGLMYVRLPDPYGGTKVVKNVVRSDGKVIPLDNAWASKVRNRNNTPATWDYYVNFFDSNTTGSYTVDMGAEVVGPLPPTLQFIPNRTTSEGTQVGFLVEATDPNGDNITLTAAPLPAGATFVDNNDGTAFFNWTPAVGQAGDYTITYTASDGSLSSYIAATIRVNPSGDSDGDGIPDDWETSQFGNLNQDGNSDFDGDGISDLDEYLLGSDPLSAYAPRMPMIKQPLDGQQTSTVQPALTIINTPDSGANTVTYDFELYRDEAMTDLAANATGVTEGTDITSWTVPAALDDNTWYYWRVRALGGGLYSPWVSGKFLVNTTNDAPGAFNISYPVDLGQVGSLTPVLEVTNSTDIDEDSLTYTFELFSDASLTTLVTSGTNIAEGNGSADGATSWQVDVPLTDASQYFWRATAQDTNGAQTQTTVASFVVNMTNNTPDIPATDAPLLSSELSTTLVELVAGNSSDLDGDPLTYIFEIDTVNTFDSANKQVSPAVVETVGTTSWTPLALTDNTRYFWRVKASDGVTESAWETADFFVNTVNEAPSIPVSNNPGERSWVAKYTPTLSVQPSIDADEEALRYEYEVYSDSDLTVPVTAVVGMGNEWNASGLLTGIQLYYWRARTEDNAGLLSDWTSVNKFVVIDTPNAIPQVTNPGAMTSAPGETVSVQFVASDSDLDTLGYVAGGLPGGLSIHPLTGLITGTVDAGAIGEHNVTVTVSDGLDTNFTQFTWTVDGDVTNSAPVITNPGDQVNTEGDSVSLSIVATDANGDTLTYSAIGLPASLSIDSVTGVISGTLAFTEAGSYTVTVSVNDGLVTSSVNFNWTVNNANQVPQITAPADQTNAEGDVVTALAVSASDGDGETLTYSATGLPSGLVIDSATGDISGTIGFNGAGTHNVTVSANDGIDTASDTFVWTVTNTNQAAIITAPVDQNSVEGATVVALSVVASDADGDTLSFSATGLPSGLTINPVSGDISGTIGFDAAGTHNVTVSANDGTDTSSDTFVWTVSNTNRAPQITAPANQTSAEGDTVLPLLVTASDLDGDTLSFSASGLPNGLVINPVSGDISGTIGYEAAGTHNVTVTVNDGIDSASDTFVWTVSNTNRAPQITAPVSQISAENDVITALAVSATDPDGDTLSYSATGLPSGLTIDPVSGNISGTITYDAAGTHNVTVSASDGTDSSSDTFTWTVSNTNRAPQITAPVNQTSAENDVVTALAVTASDPDGETLSFSATGLPSGLTIDSVTGNISGTISYDAAGTHNVTVSANDGADTTSDTFTWIVSNTNRVPLITAPANQTSAENDTIVALAVTASDPDGETLTYSATGLPSGLVIDPVNGNISGTIGYDAAGIHNVTVSASDGTDTASDTFVWTVNNTNQAPQITAPVNQTNAENDTVVGLTVTASDADGDTLSYSATGLPSGLTINSVSGVITGTIGYEAAGTHTVTVSANDGTDTSSDTFTWTVSNTNRAPVVTSPGNQTSAEADVVSLAISASDADGETLTYSATGLPASLSINSATGVITGTLAYTESGNYAVTVTASDGTDSDSVLFNWTVNNTNQVPQIAAPADQTNAENDAVIALAVVANDADGDALTYSATGLPQGLTIDAVSGEISGTIGFDAAGTHSVTVSANDGTDTSSDTFTWTVSNTNRAPLVTSPGDQLNNEEDTVSLAIVASDEDGDTLTYSATNLPDGLSINTSTGLISGEVEAGVVNSYVTTVSVSDSEDTTDVTFNWTVNTIYGDKILPGDVIGDIYNDAFMDGVYNVTGNLTVAYGATLTIKAGTQLKFASGAGLIVDGTLNVMGSFVSPVRFESSLTTPTRGSWTGVVINSTSTGSVIDYADIQWANHGVNITGASATVSNNAISNYQSTGINLSAGGGGTISDNVIDGSNDGSGIKMIDADVDVAGHSLTISGNQITNNDYGIRINKNSHPVINGSNDLTGNDYGIYIYGNGYSSGNPQPVINYNNIYGNTYYALYAKNYYNASYVMIDAEYNWWGSTDCNTIESKIYDNNDNYSSPKVDFDPALDGIDGNSVNIGGYMGGGMCDGGGGHGGGGGGGGGGGM